VTEADLLQQAVADLYSSDPDEFVERRGALAATARSAGQAPAAKQIAALRKPTRSAWVVNQLVRAVPGVISELTSLGAELRTAQGSLDGAAIRELSQRRRDLIESLARQAFTAAGQQAPPAGIRDEVTATLGAALADPQFAEQLAAGALVRAAHSEGFGAAGSPALAQVTRPVTRPAARPASRPAARPAAPTADQARAERERRRQAALAEAEQAAAEAGRDAAAATEAEQDLENTVQRLEEQLADARRSLAAARSQARRARTRERYARQARDRLRG
jgi:hypothetical protein